MSTGRPQQPYEQEKYQRFRNGLLSSFNRAGFDVVQTETHNMLRPDAVAESSRYTESTDFLTNADDIPEALTQSTEITLTAVSKDQALFETPLLRIFKNAVNSQRTCVFALMDSDEDTAESWHYTAAAVSKLFTPQCISATHPFSQADLSAPPYEADQTDGMNDPIGTHQHINGRTRSYYSTLDQLVVGDGTIVPLLPKPATGQWFHDSSGSLVYILIGDGTEDVDGTLADYHPRYGDLSVGDKLIEFPSLESFLQNDPSYVHTEYVLTHDNEQERSIRTDGAGVDHPEQPEAWIPVNRPFVPSVEFNRRPTADDWCLLHTDSSSVHSFRTYSQ